MPAPLDMFRLSFGVLSLGEPFITGARNTFMKLQFLFRSVPKFQLEDAALNQSWRRPWRAGPRSLLFPQSYDLVSCST